MPGFSESRILSGDSGTTIVAVPGILAEAKSQIAPLLPLWQSQDHRVVGLDYTGLRMNADACIKAIDYVVARELSSGQKVTVVGLSLGGMLAARALHDKAFHAGTWLILCDSPFDGDDLVIPIAKPLVPVFRKLMLAWHPGERSNRLFGKLVVDKMFANPPKDDAIEHPPFSLMSKLTDRGTYTEEQWREIVKRAAVQNVQGQKLSMWQSQVQWMLAQRETPIAALNANTAIYLRCTRRNVTVRPTASQKYGRRVPVVNVNTAHCGTLEGVNTWNAVLADLT